MLERYTVALNYVHNRPACNGAVKLVADRHDPAAAVTLRVDCAVCGTVHLAAVEDVELNARLALADANAARLALTRECVALRDMNTRQYNTIERLRMALDVYEAPDETPASSPVVPSNAHLYPVRDAAAAAKIEALLGDEGAIAYMGTNARNEWTVTTTASPELFRAVADRAYAALPPSNAGPV